MAVTYLEYLGPVPRSQLMVWLRWAANDQAWEIVEDSPTGLFLLAGSGRRLWPRFRIAMEVEESAKGTRLKMASWHPLGGWGDARGRVFRLLSKLPYRFVPEKVAGAVMQDDVVEFLAQTKRPRWVIWTRFQLPLMVFLLFGVIFGLFYHHAGGLEGVTACFTFYVSLVGMVLVSGAVDELVPRRALSIQSHQGLGTALLLLGAYAALFSLPSWLLAIY